MEEEVNASEETSQKAENENDEFSIYASRIQLLMDRALAEHRNLKHGTSACKTVTLNGVRRFIKRAYPHKTHSQLHAMGMEVMVSMYESGFEPENIHAIIKMWDQFDKKKNEKNKLWTSFDEYAISCYHKFEFRLADLKEWYREIWIADPDTVRIEMKNLENFLNAEPRKNPFKVALSNQYGYFDQLQFLECFEDFPTQTMKDIIEFMHGEEQSLLTKEIGSVVDEPPISYVILEDYEGP